MPVLIIGQYGRLRPLYWLFSSHRLMNGMIADHRNKELGVPK